MGASLKHFTSFEEMITAARSHGPKRCVVACAEDYATLEAFSQAQNNGIAKGVLYGSGQRITTICGSLKVDVNQFEIHDTTSARDAITEAVKDVARNGDFLMKGQVDTAVFLHGVLDESLGLRGERVLSHVAILELPRYFKMLAITDGGINTKLDLRRKVDIVKNAVELARFLGNEKPKVALLSAVERIKLNIAETLDWAIITRMGEEGDFGDAVIEGPLALDIAFSPEAAKIKEVTSRVTGDVDILVVPTMATGNILAKGLQYLGGAKACGIIIGARKPIVMLSRADTAETKLYSLVLGNLAS
ncbi:hypothetical protein CH330_09310 [candidate division WOR-3 bacterium JGI_Cruoil_03_51_56]|uniref:Phosphate acetyl/butaryl transferase domain-containing protein n=1 Tax=candidate division WOR-3 bacterium JGI_Cruoil_03_51_56 TaxID=1973747 RepID=A0A235BPP3_UNCW3|nr:MAG: hypothetical protein CH330_09310 [candidate division WOR-3 bacterium JGI_Cruoil_03_51_56]